MSQFKAVNPGEAWTVRETTALDQLILEAGGTITGDPGKLVIMTVAGVETPMLPGTYRDVVLTPVVAYEVGSTHMNHAENLRGALHVENGKIVPEKTVASALVGGTCTDAGIEGVSIRSVGPDFNGITVVGGTYTIKDVDISLSGSGESDFAGKGTAVTIRGDAKVEIDNLKIRNRGVSRCALIATDHSRVTVRNADIETLSGTAAERAAMTHSQVPAWPYFGNVRATNAMGATDITYIDSTVRSDGWGLLSTDDTTKPDSLDGYALNLTAINCKLEFVESYPGSALQGTPQGYGSYSIGSCHNKFVDCDMTVGGSALICANENSGGEFTGCKVESNMFGITWNGNQGGTVSLDRCSFKTADTVFIVRGCYANINVSDSTLESDTGVILTMIDSDDPGLGKKHYVFDTNVAVKDPDHDAYHVNRHDVKLFSFDKKDECTDLTANFTGCTLVGDFYNSITNAFKMDFGPMPKPDGDNGPGAPGGMPPMGGAPDGMPPMPGAPGGAPAAPGGMPPMGGAPDGMPPMPGAPAAPGGAPAAPGGAPEVGMPPFMMEVKNYPPNMVLNFTDCKITGRITASESRHHVPFVEGSFAECGRVTSKAKAPVNNGVLVSLDASSCWTVPDTCYLTSLTLAEGAQVQAPAGKQLKLTVSGVETPITAGSFVGDLVLTVN